MIEVDCETNGLQFYADDQAAFLYQFFDGENLAVLTADRREEIQQWLNRGAEEGIRAWNTKFDLHFAEKAGFKLPPETKWHDGMVEAHTVNERRSLMLESVASELFPDEDIEGPKKEVKAWLIKERARRKKEAKENKTELIEPNYSDVPKEIMHPYGAQDVLLTRRVSDQYDPILQAAPDLQEVYDFEMKVLPALYAMERRGFPVERAAYSKLENEVVNNLETLEETAIDLAQEALGKNVDFNPKSSQQTYAALEARGADLRFVTNKSMDQQNLETVDDPLALAILAYRSEYKVLSTYIRPMVERHYDSKMRMDRAPYIASDDRIHANYRQVGARTGRMSCSDPNIQNQPRDDLRLRYCFRAEEGKKLVACDLSNIEMVIFAAYAGEGKLAEALRDGKDVHAMTAELLGITDRKRSGGAIETARQRGKTFNFSQIYGGGVPTIRKQQRCDRNQAQLLKNRYYEQYPEATRLQNRILWKLQDAGYIKSAWGRRFRSDNPDREGYKYLNYIVQGTAADVIKEAAIRLHKNGVPVVGLVHDEVIAHCDASDAEEVQHEIIEALTDHPRLTDNGPKIPLRAEGATVDRWSQAKDTEFVPEFAKITNK